MKCLLLWATALLLLHAPLYAQKAICGFDQIQNTLRKDANYLQQENRTNADIQAKVNDIIQYRKLMKNLNILSGGVFEIPVVVHVIYKGSDALTDVTNYPSDAKIQEALDRLNDDFVNNSSTYTPFKFTLAKRSPACAATTGIIRINGGGLSGYNADGVALPNSSASGASDADVKNLSKWPPKMYYNIWVVHKINAPNLPSGAFIAGYATLPILGNSYHAFPNEGMMIVRQQVKYNASTLTHEIGHAMGLYHTFEGNDPTNSGANTCPVNTNPNTQGDLVSDTDPVKNLLQESPWPTNADINSCTSSPYNGAQSNIMGYGQSLTKFTAGQSTRMQAVMQAVRQGFASSQATLTPPATADQVKAASQIPTTIVENSNPANMGPCNVTLGNLTYNSYGFTRDGYQSYLDNSCNIGTHLAKNTDAVLTITTQTNAQRVKAWIDFNNNGNFEDGEIVMNHLGSTATETHTATITATTLTAAPEKNKLLRLRIMADFNGSPDFTAGSTLQYGQTEDFWVQIDNALSVSFGKLNALFKAGTLNINWDTESERNNDHFLVEGSKDGTNFFTLTTVASKAEAGNSSSALNYKINFNSNNGTLASGASLILLAILIFGLAVKNRKKLAILTTVSFLFFIACNKQDFQVVDNDNEINFIRITQVDKDGIKSMSKAVKIVKE